MKKILLLLLAFTSVAFASIRVEATYSTFGAITQKIGGDLVHVHVLASPKYDPHFIVPKPSLLSKLHLTEFDTNMSECKDKKVVQYHELFNYFLVRYNYKVYGTIEPLPGIAPSSKHTIALINTIKKNQIKLILQDVYHERKTAKFIAAKTDAKVVLIPHDMGADGSRTLEEYYKTIAKNICK